jgi:hypothetical protein
MACLRSGFSIGAEEIQIGFFSQTTQPSQHQRCPAHSCAADQSHGVESPLAHVLLPAPGVGPDSAEGGGGGPSGSAAGGTGSSTAPENKSNTVGAKKDQWTGKNNKDQWTGNKSNTFGANEDQWTVKNPTKINGQEKNPIPLQPTKINGWGHPPHFDTGGGKAELPVGEDAESKSRSIMSAWRSLYAWKW